MLLVLNNFKEDGVGEDEKGYGGKVNILNGSFLSRYLIVLSMIGGCFR